LTTCDRRLILQYLAEGSGGQTASERVASYPASMGVHKPPFCCLSPWQMGVEFVTNCKVGVVKYVVVRCLTTVLSIVLFSLGVYEEGKLALSKPFIWITAVNFISQSWALYALFLFFLCVHKDLHGMRPFSKFLCIKMIIFTSWWQALLIGILVRVGRIHHSSGHSAQEIAVFIRCTAISAEMVVAAVAFSYAFPLSEFLPTAGHRITDSITTTGSRGVMKLLAGYQKLTNSRSAKSGTSIHGSPEALGTSAELLMFQASALLQYCGLQEIPGGVSTLPGASLPAISTVDADIARTEQATMSPERPTKKPIPAARSLESLTTSPRAGAESAYSQESGAPSPLSQMTPPRPLLPQQLRHVHSAAPLLERPEQPQLRPSQRASPNLFRRESNLSATQNGEGALSPSTSSRRISALGGSASFPFSRDLEQDFVVVASEEAIQDSDSCVSDSSRDDAAFGNAGSAASLLPPHGAYSSGRPFFGANVTKTRARSGSKGHRNDRDRGGASFVSWQEALWMSLVPTDLQEDLGELWVQLTELYVASLGALALRRTLRGPGKVLAGKKIVV
jgi:hypothetical protein